jgi:lipoprotein NlpI
MSYSYNENPWCFRESYSLFRSLVALAFYSPAQGQPIANAQSHNQRGLEYAKDGNEEMAVKEFSQAIVIEPGFDAAYSNRGRVYLQQRNFAAAIQDFNKAIQIRPDAFSSYKYRADAFFDHRDFMLAIRDYSTVNEMIGVDDDAYARCAWSYLYLGDGRHAFEEMLKFLNVSADDNPKVPFMLLVGHLALRQSHRESEAKSFLLGALPLLNPDAWTTQIARYMVGMLNEDQLLAQATDPEKRLQASAFVGMNQSLKGNLISALDHLHDVVASGKTSLFEFPLAESEIHRLESVRTSR